MAYSYAQLEALWRQAGGRAAAAPVAAAIALAESGGNPDAYNARDPNGGSRGLWQINGVHGARSTFDPLGNAQAAVAISRNGADWSPWSTYNHGTYRRFLGADAGGAADGGGVTQLDATAPAGPLHVPRIVELVVFVGVLAVANKRAPGVLQAMVALALLYLVLSNVDKVVGLLNVPLGFLTRNVAGPNGGEGAAKSPRSGPVPV